MTLLYWLVGAVAAWAICYGVFLLALALPVWVLIVALLAVVYVIVRDASGPIARGE